MILTFIGIGFVLNMVMDDPPLWLVIVLTVGYAIITDGDKVDKEIPPEPAPIVRIVEQKPTYDPNTMEDLQPYQTEPETYDAYLEGRLVVEDKWVGTTTIKSAPAGKPDWMSKEL